MLAAELSSQAVSGWAGTWLWTKTVERSASRPLAKRIAASDSVD